MPRGCDLKSEEKAQLSCLFFDLLSSNKELSKTQVVKLVAKKSGRAESSIWKILAEHSSLQSQSGTGVVDFTSTCRKRHGPPCKLTESLKKKIKTENKKGNFCMPIRNLALKTKITKSTLHRYMNLMGVKITTSWLKPTLTDKQKLHHQAVRRKMPWLRGEPVVIQCDGASPHTGKDNINQLNREGQKKGWDIRFVQQRAQSPDLNVNDLGFFRSLKKLE